VTDAAYLLDTNICIYVLADKASVAARRVQQCPEGSLVTSAVTYGEILHGVRSTGPEDEGKLTRFFERIPVMPFGVAAAEAYAALPFRRGSFDRLIAAHAVSLGLVLVTNNERDFHDVRGLKVENWTRA
jgi:tRNA(fMet)-specific endonuclease VapC